jgi:hypothetical protein
MVSLLMPLYHHFCILFTVYPCPVAQFKLVFASSPPKKAFTAPGENA